MAVVIGVLALGVIPAPIAVTVLFAIAAAIEVRRRALRRTGRRGVTMKRLRGKLART